MMNNDIIDIYKKDGGVSVCIGGLGSGKTTFVIEYLLPAIYENYKRIYFFSTSGGYQKGDAYKKLKDYKVKTLPAFNLLIIQKMIEYKEKHNKEQWLLIIDDATSLDEALKSKNEVLVKMITNARHLGIRLIYIVHGSKAVLSPLLRSVISHLIICKTPNMRLIETIYEEFVAVYMEKKKFIQLYRDKVINGDKYCNFQFLNTSSKIYFYCPSV
jgi:hypothetical protein